MKRHEGDLGPSQQRAGKGKLEGVIVNVSLTLTGGINKHSCDLILHCIMWPSLIWLHTTIPWQLNHQYQHLFTREMKWNRCFTASNPVKNKINRMSEGLLMPHRGAAEETTRLISRRTYNTKNILFLSLRAFMFVSDVTTNRDTITWHNHTTVQHTT